MNTILSKKVGNLLLTFTIFILCMLYSGHVLATDPEGKNLDQLIMEWEEAGIDSNHTNTIEKISDYVNNHVEHGTFSSLHIDREERPLGIIVLSFTKEIKPEIKKEIESFVEEPAEVSFRVVKYTEEQLMEKQREIDSAIFEQDVLKKDGISVHQTATDIINNIVEIGISPFNDKTAQIVYDYFGNEMISVVQGHEVHPLTKESTSDTQDINKNNAVIPISAEDEVQQYGFFTKIFGFFTGLFK